MLLISEIMLRDKFQMKMGAIALPTAPKILFAPTRESSTFQVYETHPLCSFCKRSIVDEFRELTRHCSSLLAPGAEQLLAVQRNERCFILHSCTLIVTVLSFAGILQP